MPDINIREYNREAWNRSVESGENPWTQPVSPEVIARARRGDFAILLTQTQPVPRAWFPPLAGADILCLASGGGQQGPVLAAAGAHVTVFDNSPRQLERDRFVAEREGLHLKLVEGDAADLSMFADESFDLVFNPVSTVFMKDVRAVWREVSRVLRHGGALLTGMMNPVHYLFDFEKMDAGILEVKHAIPYSDTESLSQAELEKYIGEGMPLEFGHSLADLLGGQCAAGLHIVDLYEDHKPGIALAKFHPSYVATRAIKQ